MVEIKPFIGWYYDTDKAGDIRSLVAPPHDVISPEEQERLYEKSKCNTVRVILPKNGYNEAKQTLEKMTSDGAIIKDIHSAYYVYEQKFSQNGNIVCRLGFLATVRAGKLGKDVLPHEMVFPEKAEDRLNLFTAIKANLSPIFGLYSGNREISKILDSVRANKPLFEFEDDCSVINRIWPLYDTEQLTKLLRDEKIIIADGHHRYTASYKLAEKEGGDCAFTLMYLVDLNDPALKILPTHRLLKHTGFDIDAFITNSSEFFDVSEIEDFWKLDSLLVDSDKHTFGVHTKNKSYLLKLKDPEIIEKMIDGGKSKEWKHLEISVLNKIIIDKLVGTDYEELTFAKHPQDVVDLISDSTYQVAFLLGNSSVDEISKIVANQEVMPHKATYFYPKPLAGLIIRKMEDF